MKCQLCNNDVPINRAKHSRVKYCSEICNKRSWYYRNVKVNNPVRGGFKQPVSESQKGYYWEEWATKLLQGAVNVNQDVLNQSYDLLYKGDKIDVKSCNLYKRKLKRGKPANSKGWWVFNRNKRSEIDYFLCICLIEDKPFKTYMIPSLVFPEKGCVIGWKSKYDKYLIF